MAKKKENILHDFGKVTIAEDWSEVTLEQFTQIMRISGDNGQNVQDVDVRDLICILTGKDKEWVNLLPAKFVQTLITKLTFMSVPPKSPASNEVTVNGEVYRVNFMEELTFGEYTDVNTLIQADGLDYAGFLAVLCRKPDEAYNDEFTAHIDQRKEFWNSQPLTTVLPVIAFFLHLWGISEIHSPASLAQMQDLASQLLSDIDSSRKSGDYRRLPMLFRAKVWWKLRKCRKCLQQLSSSTSHT